MTISGLFIELGATYEAKRIENDETVYGIGVIKVDEEKSFLIQSFETNDFVDCAPAMAYYIPVKSNTIISYNDFDIKNKENVYKLMREK